ncbi:MAG: type IV pilus assembly protein PilM [Proteobacteria bacterium]|nr:type IV pilus assembly protein PilM [Pseudomonadota bacterium]
MAKGKLLLGLDIGSSAAKLCLLKEVRGKYSIEVVDREVLPQDAIVDGAILDRTGVANALRNLIRRCKLKQKQCAIAIAGYSVIVKRLRLSNMTDDELAENIKWEVEQHIPYESKDVVYDTVVLGRNPAQNSMDILLVASKREVVQDYIGVCKDAGFDVKIVDVASFALQNMVETVYGEARPDECIGVINIGASVTSMTMMTDGVTSFTRDITIGGNQITEEIQKKLGINRDEAENFKTGNLGDGHAVIPREVEEITEQVSQKIADEIKRSLMFFYETSGRERVDKLILCGGVVKNSTTFRILEKVIGESIQVANPFEHMGFNYKMYSPQRLNDLALESAISLGLALRRDVE